MMISITSLLAALLAMAASATAHMIMANPVPYGKPNNSPLDPSGADFPCKRVGSDPFTVNTQNNWPVGSKQELSFTGTAAHSGGSCQISVTTDKEPTKASKWKVIYSIEGGCPPPPPEGDGNYHPGDPTKPLSGFEFTVPSELPNGDLAMSWTWFNKVGQREMYQNCAPVTITGGSTDMAAFDSLPDMAVANIASQGSCATTETFDYTFENPGKYKIQNGQGPFKPLCAPKAGAGGSTSDPAAPQLPASPGMSSQAPPANAGIATPSQAAVSSNNDKLTSTVRQVLTVTAPSAPGPTPQQGAASAPAVAQPSPQPSQGSAAPAPGGAAPPAGQTCSPDGSVVCSADGKQFAICNWGKAVFQPVAQGTTCKGGKMVKRADCASTLRTIYA